MNQCLRQRGSTRSTSEQFLMSARANASEQLGHMSRYPSHRQTFGCNTTHTMTLSSSGPTSARIQCTSGNDVGRILVDNGSSADILVWQCFVKMGFTETALHKSQYPLIGFGGKRIEALGKIDLNVTFDERAAVTPLR